MAFGIFCSVPFTESPFALTVNAASVDDLTFRLNDDGESYSISRCKTTASGDLTIPSTYSGLPVTSIGNDAFEDCTSLTSRTIPDSVTSIGEDAFSGCTNLKSVYITDLASWLNIDFNNYYYSSPLYYADNLYINGELVKNIVIPDGVTSIPVYGLSCNNITSVVIPNSVTSIGNDAFEDCANLKSVTIPDSVTSIGWDAFSGCTSLTSVTIPDSVTSISSSAFSGCTSLATVTIDNSVTSIPYRAFYGCKSLTSITIPDSVTSIGDSAFFGCTGLTSITIPDSVTSIGRYAFGGCTSLTSVTIPDSVTSIGNDAFSHCTSLTSVTIPDSVTSIDDYAFYGCTSLSDVYYAGTEEEWNNISIGHGNINLTNARRHYSVTDPTNHWNGTFKDPTCTEAGIKNGSCSCGYSVNETVAATGHKSGGWITDKTPTCTATGTKHKECTVCKEVLETGTIEKIGHKYVQKSVQTEHPHQITYECTACKDTKTESSVVSRCVECNFTITPIDSSSYNLVSYIGEETDVVIPTTYKERAITTISNGCFRNNSNITSVKIESGVTSIGSIVFMNCTSLQKVYIPASVTSIGINAFYKFTGTIYCTSGSAAYEYAVANNLNYVVLNIVETANTRIDYDNVIIRTSVQNCGELTDIFGVADTVTAIPIASYIYGKLGLYGTGTIISVFDGDEYVGDYTLIVEGDTNGDSVCDVLDCFNVEHSSNGNGELSGVYKSVADINEDGAVDVNDYQAVVNRALG